VIVNHYAPFEGETGRWSSSFQHHYTPFDDRTTPRGFLEDATDDLVRGLLVTNTYLTARDGSARSMQLDGWPAYRVVLSGRSPVTGDDERVTVYTRALPDDHVIYGLCIVPARDFAVLERTCTRMMQTLRVNDNAAHRTTGAALRSGFRPPER
jgi:hypothetical protein